MTKVLDLADRASWWLAHHLRATAAIVVGVLALLVVLFLVTGEDDGGIPAGAVATVGDAPITRADLDRWQGIYTKAVAGAAQPPTEEEARMQAFELLAGSAWITEEADRLELSVTDGEVSESLDEYFKQSGASTPQARSQLLGQLGIGEEELRFQQRVSLISNKLRERAVKDLPAPSPAQVKKAYDEEPQRWATPSERDIEVVVSRDEATARKARAAIEGGRTFAEANTEFSSDAALTEAKGAIPKLKPGANAPSFERAVFGAEPDSLEGPVQVQGGWMVFRVKEARPLAERTLEQATKAITDDLRAVAQQGTTEKYLTDLRKRWKAKTSCSALVAKAELCRTD
ncbi:MAG: PpiC-type peptidyl-prolyl cis-trans isomerase [Solirubrobacterales bacterium]|jgi:foldase protein PrsA|nr:PpiC-type peptidyl-prolyl cis-trans isomerase [Solirubrobacterales bacterium]